MRILIVLFVGLMTSAPSLVSAQMPTATPGASQRRGDRALFGGGVGNTEQLLSVSSNLGASFYELYGTTLTGEPATTRSRTVRGSAALAYRLGLPYLQVGASAGGFSYYSPYYTRESGEQWFSGYTVSADASTSRTWQLSRRSTLAFNQGVAVLPAFVNELLPFGVAGIVDSADPGRLLPPDVSTFEGFTLDSITGLSFNHDFSRRVAFYNTYGFIRRWTFGREEPLDRMEHSVASGLSVELTRYLRVRGGYRFYASRGEPGMPYLKTNSADIGIDFNRGGSIRLTRRTTMTFGLGLAAMTDSSMGQRYFVLGNAGLMHEIGRTWSASAQYSRNLDFSSLFQAPSLSDNITASFGGLISSRLSFQSGGGYTRSAIGFSGVDNRNELAYGVAGLQTGLTRYVAVGVNWAYYYRSTGASLVLPADLAPRSESQAIQVFLSAWAPLYQRMRRTNGTR